MGGINCITKDVFYQSISFHCPRALISYLLAKK